MFFVLGGGGGGLILQFSGNNNQIKNPFDFKFSTTKKSL